MWQYCLMLGLPATYAVISSFKGLKVKNKDKGIIDVFFILFLVLLTFRSKRLGVDLPVYEYHFRNFSKMSWGELGSGIIGNQFEAGYALLSKFISIITSDFHLVIITCALISIVPIWILYRDNAKHGFLIIVLFVCIAPFPMYFSGLRQILAMAFTIPCYKYCKEKDILKYLLMIVVAYLCHRSAIVLLLMYPVYHFKTQKRLNLFMILTIVAVVNLFKVQLFTISISLLDVSYESYLEGIKSTGAYAIFALLILFLIYSYVLVDKNRLDEEIIGLRNVLVLCVILQSFASIHTIAMRMNYYYLIFIPLLIPKIIDAGNTKYRQIIELSIVLMGSFFFVYYFYNAMTGSDTLGIYPYVSLFADN